MSDNIMACLHQVQGLAVDRLIGPARNNNRDQGGAEKRKKKKIKIAWVRIRLMLVVILIRKFILASPKLEVTSFLKFCSLNETP